MLYQVNNCQYTMKSAGKILSTAWEYLREQEVQHNPGGRAMVFDYGKYNLTPMSELLPVNRELPTVEDFLYISCGGKLHRLTVVVVNSPSIIRPAEWAIRALDPEGRFIDTDARFTRQCQTGINIVAPADGVFVDTSMDSRYDDYRIPSTLKKHEQVALRRATIRDIDQEFKYIQEKRNELLLSIIEDIHTGNLNINDYKTICEHAVGAEIIKELFDLQPAILMDRPE